MSTSTNTSSKLTNASAIAFVLDTYADTLPADVAEKLTNIQASFVKKASYKSTKPTAKQTENASLYNVIKDYLAENGRKTISALCKEIPELADISGQRVSAIIRPHLGVEIVRTEEKRVAYFSIAE